MVPPGTFAITVQSKEIICPMAHSTVRGVLCKCKAQYNVATSVPPYVIVSRSLSLENICFKYAIGPHKKKKLKEGVYFFKKPFKGQLKMQHLVQYCRLL